MCPYLSLSCRNPHTVIQSNRRTLWSRRQFSCTPTLASTLSTSCFNCILNKGCCWEVCVLGCFLCILRSICILWDFSSFFALNPPPIRVAVESAGCGSFSSSGGRQWWRRWRGGGTETVSSLFLFFFTPPPSWCLSLDVCGRGGFCALLVDFWLVLLCRWLLLH